MPGDFRKSSPPANRHSRQKAARPAIDSARNDGAIRSDNVRWKAFATDFDGTLADEGIVPVATKEALARLRAEGMHTLLVTGRELSDFEALEMPLTAFDLVVAENGASLFDPHRQTLVQFGEPPPPEFAQELVRRGATPVSVGRSIVATVVPFEIMTLELIREMGLEHQIIFNKGAVMVLPPGVNKAAGLSAALERLALRPEDVVGVGDGENDHAFLKVCGFSVAVANALPALRKEVMHVTAAPSSEGVRELIEALRHGSLDRFPEERSA